MPFSASTARSAAMKMSPEKPTATQISPFARSEMYCDEWK